MPKPHLHHRFGSFLEALYWLILVYPHPFSLSISHISGMNMLSSWHGKVQNCISSRQGQTSVLCHGRDIPLTWVKSFTGTLKGKVLSFWVLSPKRTESVSDESGNCLGNQGPYVMNWPPCSFLSVFSFCHVIVMWSLCDLLFLWCSLFCNIYCSVTYCPGWLHCPCDSYCSCDSIVLIYYKY